MSETERDTGGLILYDRAMVEDEIKFLHAIGCPRSEWVLRNVKQALHRIGVEQIAIPRDAIPYLTGNEQPTKREGFKFYTEGKKK